VGRELATRLRTPFADADDLHTDAAKRQMAEGIPLDDTQREPWLKRVAGWIAAHPDGCVAACSALKRSYRDILREHSAAESPSAKPLVFLHLMADDDVVTARVSHRPGHFMPAKLVESQFEALEPLAPDEAGVAIDATASAPRIVSEFLEWSRTRFPN
jgi:carbohydrate kinase (thermoresistant glucokinase family)